MNYEEIEKIVVEMDNWNYQINLQTTYQNVSAVKVRWLSYTTKSAGGKILSLQSSDLGDAGIIPNVDRSNTKYFLSVPIDTAFPVTCLYGNTTDTYDKLYRIEKNVNQLQIQAFINGLPASSEIDVSNPLLFEIAFYRSL